MKRDERRGDRDALLGAARFRADCPNGLQVDARTEVHRRDERQRALKRLAFHRPFDTHPESGVNAHLAAHFGVEHRFIDLANPVCGRLDRSRGAPGGSCLGP